MKKCTKDFLKDWDFKKHLKIVSAIYVVCYVIDLTLGFLLVKKIKEQACEDDA